MCLGCGRAARVALVSSDPFEGAERERVAYATRLESVCGAPASECGQRAEIDQPGLSVRAPISLCASEYAAFGVRFSVARAVSLVLALLDTDGRPRLATDAVLVHGQALYGLINYRSGFLFLWRDRSVYKEVYMPPDVARLILTPSLTVLACEPGATLELLGPARFAVRPQGARLTVYDP